MKKGKPQPRTMLRWRSAGSRVEAAVQYSHRRAGIWVVHVDNDGVVRVEFDGHLLATAPNLLDGRQYAECAAAALGHRP